MSTIARKCIDWSSDWSFRPAVTACCGCCAAVDGLRRPRRRPLARPDSRPPPTCSWALCPPCWARPWRHRGGCGRRRGPRRQLG